MAQRRYLDLTGLTNLVTNIRAWVASIVPTKTSELDNDANFITSSDLPTNHVTTNTNQTITSTKYFQNVDVYLKQTGITLGTTPSSNQYKSVQSVDNNGTVFAQLVYVQRKDGNTYIELRAGDKFTSGAKATSGTQVWSDFQVGTSPDGNKYIYTDALWSNSLVPYHDNTSSLGNATHRWTNVYGTVRLDPSAGATADLLYSQMAANDLFRLQVGGTSNNGYVEIATADDGNEPIYVRQYKGVFATLQRTLTLLDGSGNTTLPGTLNAVSYKLNGTAFGDIVTHNASEFLTSHQSLSNYATKSYVDTSVANLVNSAPTTLDTLNELATALGNDPNFATTVATSIGTKANDSDVVHLAGTETVTGSKSFDSTINSSINTQTWLNGNNGKAIINSTAAAGSYVALIKSNSSNGHFTLSQWGGGIYLNYTVGTETQNRTTKSAILLSEEGDTTLPGYLHTNYVFGDGKAAFRAHINAATSAWSYGISILNAAMSANQYIFCPIGKAYSPANCAGIRFQWVGNSSNDNNIGFEFYGTGSPLVVYKDGRATLSASPDTSDNSTRIATTAYVKSQGYLTSHQDLSNYVTVNGTQTVSGQKTFTANQFFTSGVYQRRDTYTLGNTVTNNQVTTYNFVDSANAATGYCRSVIYKTSNLTSTEIAARNKIKNDALDTTGEVVTAQFFVRVESNGNKYIAWDGSVKNSVIPYSTNTYDLGSSTLKWSNVYATTFTGNLTGDVTGNVTGNCSGSSGSCTGNSATATQFSAKKSVTLTGDVTGTASSKAGWSVATTLANSGVTAGTYGPSADVTGNNNATISVPEITVDAKGRVTSVTNRTLTCKNNTYSVYNKTLTIQKNGTNVATFTSNSNTDVTANITVPTKTSDLTNDSGFLTSHQSLVNYVTASSNDAQAITGPKFFRPTIYLQDSNVTSIDTTQSTLTNKVTQGSIAFRAQTQTYGTIEHYFDTDRSSVLEFNSFNKKTTGQSIYANVVLRNNVDGIAEFSPGGSGYVNLGSADRPWHTINGINPGSLGLPSVGNATAYDIDTTNWDVTGADIHVIVKDAYNNTVPGYLMIMLSKCAATDYVIIQLTSMARSAGVYVPTVKATNGNYYVKACFPTRGDCNVNIIKTAGTIGYAKLYPFIGNQGFTHPNELA
jgi:hypothetical protein